MTWLELENIKMLRNCQILNRIQLYRLIFRVIKKMILQRFETIEVRRVMLKIYLIISVLQIDKR